MMSSTQSTISNLQSTIPKSWRWVKLGEVCEVEKGKTPSESHYAEKGVRIIKYRDINKDGTINWTGGFRSFVPPSYAQSLRPLTSKTTLIGADAHDPSSIGKKVAYVMSVPQKIGACYYSGEMIGIKIINESIIDPYWPFLWFISDDGYQVIQSFVEGLHLNKGQAVQMPIPLPPLSDQHRITAKIQALMQEVKQAKESCEKQLEAAQTLPSAYLREVFDSPEARKWEKKRLGEVCDTTSGGTPDRGNKHYFNGDIPWVKSGELKDSYISDTEEKITKLGLENSSAKIFPAETLLIAMYGANVGKLGILRIFATTNQAICGILSNPHILIEFLFFFLLNHRKDLIDKSFGSGQPNISQGVIKNIYIPLPSVSEQHRIAADLKEKMSESESLQSKILNQQSTISALPQSILRKAFRGEL